MKALSHKQISKRGGMKTLEKYGKEHYSRMGSLGVEPKLKKYGSDYYKKLSALGVTARQQAKKQP